MKLEIWKNIKSFVVIAKLSKFIRKSLIGFAINPILMPAIYIQFFKIFTIFLKSLIASMHA